MFQCFLVGHAVFLIIVSTSLFLAYKPQWIQTKKFELSNFHKITFAFLFITFWIFDLLWFTFFTIIFFALWAVVHAILFNPCYLNVNIAYVAFNASTFIGTVVYLGHGVTSRTSKCKLLSALGIDTLWIFQWDASFTIGLTTIAALNWIKNDVITYFTDEILNNIIFHVFA